MSPSPVHRLAYFACWFFYAVSLRFTHFLPTAEPGLRVVRKKDKSSFVPLSSVCREGKRMYEKVWRTFSLCLHSRWRSHVHSIPDTFFAARKPYRIGLLFTNNNGDLCVISVTDRCCLAPIWGFAGWRWNNSSKNIASTPTQKKNLTSFEKVLNPNL